MDTPMRAETVTITGHNGDEIEAYFATPTSPGPHPGVVVIHHMPGYDRSTKEIVRTFAVYGYAALCPNLHHRYAPGAKATDGMPRPPSKRAAFPTTNASATCAARSTTCARSPTRTAGSA